MKNWYCYNIVYIVYIVYTSCSSGIVLTQQKGKVVEAVDCWHWRFMLWSHRLGGAPTNFTASRKLLISVRPARKWFQHVKGVITILPLTGWLQRGCRRWLQLTSWAKVLITESFPSKAFHAMHQLFMLTSFENHHLVVFLENSPTELQSKSMFET